MEESEQGLNTGLQESQSDLLIATEFKFAVGPMSSSAGSLGMGRDLGLSSICEDPAEVLVTGGGGWEWEETLDYPAYAKTWQRS